MNEQITIKEILTGDVDSYRKIVTKYGPEIRIYLASRIRNNFILDDLTQDILIAAYWNLGKFKQGSNLGAWIQGIAKNKFKEWLRKQQTGKESILRNSLPLIEWLDREMECFENPQPLMEKLRGCIEKLPDKLWDLVNQRYFHGEAVQDIAQHQETSVSAISSHLYRARGLLKECIKMRPQDG